MIIENKTARAEISFCDDEKDCLEKTSNFLRKYTNHNVSNFHITKNFDHDKFIKHFCEKDFDLTILDLQMPLNWYEFFRSIRENDPEHPIVIYTAYKAAFEGMMAKLHVTEEDDPLIKIIPKESSIKSQDLLLPQVENFAKISILRKLNKQLSTIVKNSNEVILNKAMRNLEQVPDKISNFAKKIEEAYKQKNDIDSRIKVLREYLQSKEVWDYFYKKGTEQSNLLLLLKKFLLSVSTSDITDDALKVICYTLSALSSESDHETLNNTHNSLKRLMRTKGVSIIPPIRDINSLLESYEDELWGEEE